MNKAMVFFLCVGTFVTVYSVDHQENTGNQREEKKVDFCYYQYTPTLQTISIAHLVKNRGDYFFSNDFPYVYLRNQFFKNTVQMRYVAGQLLQEPFHPDYALCQIFKNALDGLTREECWNSTKLSARKKPLHEVRHAALSPLTLPQTNIIKNVSDYVLTATSSSDKVPINRQFTAFDFRNASMNIGDYAVEHKEWMYAKQFMQCGCVLSDAAKQKFLDHASEHGNLQDIFFLAAYGVLMSHTIVSSPLHKAACYGHSAIVRLLLTFCNKKDLNWKQYPDNHTPLHCAVHACRLGCVRELLCQGAAVNEFDVNEQTPLHLAAAIDQDIDAEHKKNGTQIVMALLEAKADVNRVDKKKTTPLQIASKYGNTVCMQQLLDANANPGYKQQSGYWKWHESVFAYQKKEHVSELEKKLIDMRLEKRKKEIMAQKP